MHVKAAHSRVGQTFQSHTVMGAAKIHTRASAAAGNITLGNTRCCQDIISWLQWKLDTQTSSEPLIQSKAKLRIFYTCSEEEIGKYYRRLLSSH